MYKPNSADSNLPQRDRKSSGGSSPPTSKPLMVFARQPPRALHSAGGYSFSDEVLKEPSLLSPIDWAVGKILRILLLARCTPSSGSRKANKAVGLALAAPWNPCITFQQLHFRQPQKEVNDGQTPDGDKCAVIRTGWVFNQRATSIQQESNKGFQTEKEKSVAEQDLFGLSDSQRRFSPGSFTGSNYPWSFLALDQFASCSRPRLTRWSAEETNDPFLGNCMKPVGPRFFA